MVRRRAVASVAESGMRPQDSPYSRAWRSVRCDLVVRQFVDMGGRSSRDEIAFRDVMSLHIRRSRNSPGMRRERFGASFRAADSGIQ